MMTDQSPRHLLPLLFPVDDTHHRRSRDTTQVSTKLLKNHIHNSTVLPSFETCPEDIYTTPLIREQNDSYLYCIDTHSLVETLLMNSLFQSLSRFLLIQMKALVETSIPSTFRFLSLMFSPHFSKISRKKRIPLPQQAFTPLRYTSIPSRRNSFQHF